MAALFDFDDGQGPRPAARHRNPDGSEGGWVAATATVGPTSWVNEDAHVFGRARIEDGCDVEYFARVYEDAYLESGATVEGPVHVRGRARLTRTASMSGYSVVRDDAVLSGTMFGYTTLAGDSFVAEGVKLMPLARILSSGRIEADDHYFCGYGGPIQGHWTFYRGREAKVWLCLGMSDARPAEEWIEECDRAGAAALPKYVSAASLRTFLDFVLRSDVIRDW